MAATGRNQPCPCGSGRKYKRCCLAAAREAPGFSAGDRAAALARIERFCERALAGEDDNAFDEFWEQAPPDADERIPEETLRSMAEPAYDMWFWFDRPLGDGRRVVERLLVEDPSITAGERRYLETARDARVRLYEVLDTVPGVSVTLRDLLDGATVTVHERIGSRHMGRADLLAARILPAGASGKPELETGALPLPRLGRDSIISQVSSLRATYRRDHRGGGDEAMFRDLPALLFGAWVAALLDPPLPRVQNTDGEDLLDTRTHFDVRDRGRVARALDAGEGLETDGKESDRDERTWRWSGPNRDGKDVLLGSISLRSDRLRIETNSAARGQRGRAMVEALAGDAVVWRGTSHEDPVRKVREALRSQAEPAPDPDGPEDIPFEIREDLTLDHLARHYRGWIDEAIPRLDGRTPRAAAGDPRLRPRLEGMLRELEGMYLHALRSREPAYDPSWMWAELGLAGGSPPEHPPPLAHERWAEAVPGWAEVCRAVAGRARARPGFDDASTVVGREEMESDLDVRRLLREQRAREAPDRAAPAGGDAQAAKLAFAINHELHRRKTFWIDEALVAMLSHTDLDLPGELLRVPFPCFALVLTDRHALSLAERLLAADAAGPLAGHLLRVLTVYAIEEPAPAGRVLRLGFAADALGADPPHLLEHALALRDGARVDPYAGGRCAEGGESVVVEGEGPVPRAAPLPGLAHLVLNAILYATSAGARSEVRPPPRDPPRRTAAPAVPFSSDEVYFLPGQIEVSQVRRLQDLARVPAGRTLLHRFMVRGHWRRAAAAWKDQRLRWIEPYWKGPDLAAVIERAYHLTP